MYHPSSSSQSPPSPPPTAAAAAAPSYYHRHSRYQGVHHDLEQREGPMVNYPHPHGLHPYDVLLQESTDDPSSIHFGNHNFRTLIHNNMGLYAASNREERHHIIESIVGSIGQDGGQFWSCQREWCALPIDAAQHLTESVLEQALAQRQKPRMRHPFEELPQSIPMPSRRDLRLTEFPENRSSNRMREPYGDSEDWANSYQYLKSPLRRDYYSPQLDEENDPRQSKHHRKSASKFSPPIGGTANNDPRLPVSPISARKYLEVPMSVVRPPGQRVLHFSLGNNDEPEECPDQHVQNSSDNTTSSTTLPQLGQMKRQRQQEDGESQSPKRRRLIGMKHSPITKQLLYQSSSKLVTPDQASTTNHNEMKEETLGSPANENEPHAGNVIRSQYHCRDLPHDMAVAQYVNVATRRPKRTRRRASSSSSSSNSVTGANSKRVAVCEV